MANENDDFDIENEEDEEETTEETEAEEEDVFEEEKEEIFDETDDLRNEILTLKKQKEHWRRKASKETVVKVEKEVETEVEEEAPSKDNDRLDRMELNSLDIRDSEEQDIVITQASARGISLSEAVNNPAVLFEIKEIQEKTKTKEAMQTSGRKEGKASSLDAKLSKFKRTGKLPDDENDMYAILNASRK